MDIDTLFKKFNNKHALIIGDSMIDEYVWGEINRISPEAPVKIIEIKTNEKRLGGAANVALNIQSLGAKPILCSVIGNDNDGLILKNLMKNAKLETKGLLVSNKRKTTVKKRIIANNEHQIRLDKEDTHQINIEKQLIKTIKQLISNAKIDIIILQDYNKGVLTPKIIQTTIKEAKNKNIPTIVDPKKNNFFEYKNCTIFKPNLFEINHGMNINLNINKKNEIKNVTEQLRKLLNTDAVLLTLSSKGLCINSKNNFKYTPAFKRNMLDVSGAGDTVIAVAALCLTCNTDFNTLSKISCLAGGLVCESVGVVPINKKTLILKTKEELCNE